MPSDPPPGPPSPEPASTRSDGSYRPFRDPQVILLVLIVLGTFAVMAGGLGTGPPFGDDNESSGPVFPVFDYDGEERPEAEALSLTANRTTIDPGQAVTFSVRAKDKPVANVTLSGGDRSEKTDRNGTAVLTFAEPGRYQVVLAPTTGEDTSTERVTVTVRRYEVDLAAATSPAKPVTGQPVTVELTRADTGAAIAGTVVAGGQTVQTGADGRANVTFETAGSHTVTVRAPKTGQERFVPAETTVQVQRRVVNLDLGLGTSDPQVDEQVPVRVSRADTGAPVNATVTVGNVTTTTGTDGQTNVSLSTAGEYTVSAAASQTAAVRFRNTTTGMTVKRQVVDLELAVDRTSIQAGERVTFALRRADTGERVAGTVDLYGTPYLTTDEGRLRVAFQTPGTVTAVGNTSQTPRTRFVPASRDLTILGPDWTVTALDAPGSVQRNDSVTVTARVANEGNTGATEQVTYRVGDETLATTTVSLDPGESTAVRLTVDAVDLPAGEYTQSVVVDDASVDATLTVTGNQTEAT